MRKSALSLGYIILACIEHNVSVDAKRLAQCANRDIVRDINWVLCLG